MRSVPGIQYDFALWRKPLLQQSRGLVVLSALAFVLFFGPSWANAQNPATAQPGGKTGSQAEKYRSALLIEAETGKVLFEKDPHLPLPPASMVKMMTALIVMEKVRDGAIKLSDLVTVSRWASKMGGSQVFLKEGEKMSVEELMKAMMVHSANDATAALAE